MSDPTPTLVEFLLASAVESNVETPATASTVPGRGPTELESNMSERTAPVCGCVTTGKIVRGMCAMHYDRWVHATPKGQRSTAPRFVRDFWDYVDKSSSDRGCWLWMGNTNRGGYGCWSTTEYRGLAHRYSLAQVTPPPDPALFACHHCDVRSCVNPAHLYWGDVRDNARDLLERGHPANQNTYKTHCKNGHELAGENLRIVGREQRRQCRICDNERSRIKMAARRAKALIDV